MKSRDRLLRLQKRLYLSLKRQADRLLGAPPKPILRYQREFERDFPSRLKYRPTVTKNELIREIRSAHVTFIADFHTFPQAQRTALRILRDSVRPDEEWVVGLEMIPTHRQPELDAFQKGEMTLEDFLEAIRYDEIWGFPWRNYAPIFDWARENGIRLIGLNQPREVLRQSLPTGATLRRVREDTELQDRDRWAAGVLTDLFAGNKRLKVVVLYGELHIASSHIPKELQTLSRSYLGKPLRCVSLHQNHDRTYWQIAEIGQETKTEAVALKSDCYCVFSSTPWTKLESLVSWAEGGAAGESEVALDLDEFSDPLSSIRSYVDHLAAFFKVESVSCDDLTVYSIDQADFIDELPADRLAARELALIRHHVHSHQRLFIPRLNVAYLGGRSQNSAVEIAATHLFRSKIGDRALLIQDYESLSQAVLESAFGFLGSLILNPKRKCDLPEDHRQRIRSITKGSPESFRYEKWTRSLALKALQHESKMIARESFRFPGISQAISSRRHAPALHLSARFMGQILGKKLHQSLLDGKIDLDAVREIFLVSSDHSYEWRLLRALALARKEKTHETKTQTL